MEIQKFKDFTENILVIDVESTCLEKVSEIIEIGLSDTKNTFNNCILIKPIYSKINDFCTNLTSLTTEYIEKNGEEYNLAYDTLNKISIRYNTWASYGDYDKEMFEKMSKLYNIKINLPTNHINVRTLFAQKILKTEDLKNAPKNPKDALIELGYEFSGFNHRGIDDAKNISFLLKLLL
jgi:inhibitor of KinA sporulation pathway (predicted exonuclease)